MIEYSTPAIPANDGSSDVHLHRAQIWRGLRWKAEFPTLFVRPIKECRVLETYPDGLLREILHEDDLGTEWLQERIFFHDDRAMTFLRMNGRVHGQILNLIEGDDDDPTLRFAFTLGIEGEPHGGGAEQRYLDQFEKGYVIAVNATLDAVREAVRSGVDPTAALAREREAATTP
jgi:hypothetical protein